MANTVIYLDKFFNYQKSTTDPSNPLGPPIVTNYVLTDQQVRMIGIMYSDTAGDNFIACVDDDMQTSSQDHYSYPIKRFIQTKSGAWLSQGVVYTYNLSYNRFIGNTLDSNFGFMYRTNTDKELYFQGTPQEDGSLSMSPPEGYLNEIDFFLNAIFKGIYPAPFTITLPQAYGNMLNNCLSAGLI